ncbi:MULTISPECIES: M24 family metallopeptidase [unclassified Candidatus Frackibacter]|uniref:M24 family metallopeptidase n=1 Tax=unclassified Candidatus Frackibacter TaxID=2648818 RepID=UPI00088CD684|nr:MULTISPECIES: Xaa-Pro peptidase family protein [unclassified Candidatus Frackibacter]SDC11565.1 Xaa-Pro aminopeptidase [Candidatus Frackibacter sp. WG11]SFL41662.1 Xaa-Pro aminopeptidase [Candidatus Frackibacter sp. WG13]
METIPKEELIKRKEGLQEKLTDKGIDLAVIIQNADLYYFAGTIQAEYLFIPQTGDPILFVRRGIERAENETGIEKVVEFKSSREIPDVLAKEGINFPKKLGLELDILPYQTATKLQSLLEVNNLVNITTLIRQSRMIKSDYEVKLMKRAANHLSTIPKVISENLQPGMSELELSAIIENHLRKQGHSGLVRMRGLNNEIPMGVCVVGDNAEISIKTDALCGGSGLHASIGIGSSHKKITEGEPIVVDFVSNYQGYHVDQTRLAVLGEPSAYLQETHEKMVNFLDRLSEYLIPQHSWKEIYEEGKRIAEELEVAEYFMGYGDNKVRFVGHGVGLELNEFPFLADGLNFDLEPGMAIALEPKLLVPDVGAIGIENTYLVTEDKPQKLTHTSEELITVK